MILYKYLTPDRIDVLQNCMVRYTQPGAFNDPFEVKPYISNSTFADRYRQIKLDVIGQGRYPL